MVTVAFNALAVLGSLALLRVQTFEVLLDGRKVLLCGRKIPSLQVLFELLESLRNGASGLRRGIGRELWRILQEVGKNRR